MTWVKKGVPFWVGRDRRCRCLMAFFSASVFFLSCAEDSAVPKQFCRPVFRIFWVEDSFEGSTVALMQSS